MMMWAEHCHRLELLHLLSAQWQRPLLEWRGLIFFGGFFDKRDGMLFAARSLPAGGTEAGNEDGNVHRRAGAQKL